MEEGEGSCGTEHLGDLDYADDIVLLSHNFGDMQEKLDDLVDESQKVGLRESTTEAFRIGGEAIERVDEFL